MNLMKAVRLHRYGNPDVLVYEDAPRPEPNVDEVLIRVYGAGVNPADWKLRQGYLQEKFPFPIFVTPTDSAQLRQIAKLIDRKEIQPPRIESFPLQDAAEAHTAIQYNRRRGKVVLQVS